MISNTIIVKNIVIRQINSRQCIAVINLVNTACAYGEHNSGVIINYSYIYTQNGTLYYYAIQNNGIVAAISTPWIRT